MPVELVHRVAGVADRAAVDLHQAAGCASRSTYTSSRDCSRMRPRRLTRPSRRRRTEMSAKLATTPAGRPPSPGTGSALTADPQQVAALEVEAHDGVGLGAPGRGGEARRGPRPGRSGCRPRARRASATRRARRSPTPGRAGCARRSGCTRRSRRPGRGRRTPSWIAATTARWLVVAGGQARGRPGRAPAPPRRRAVAVRRSSGDRAHASPASSCRRGAPAPPAPSRTRPAAKRRGAAGAGRLDPPGVRRRPPDDLVAGVAEHVAEGVARVQRRPRRRRARGSRRGSASNSARARAPAGRSVRRLIAIRRRVGASPRPTPPPTLQPLSAFGGARAPSAPSASARSAAAGEHLRGPARLLRASGARRAGAAPR